MTGTDKEYTGYKHRTGDKKVDDFIMELEKYAVENGILITNIEGWTLPKLKWMATHERRCCCAPATRKCPCKAGLYEIFNTPKRTCLCSVFKHPNKNG